MARAKKVEENHAVVSETEEKNVAEQLIEEQGLIITDEDLEDSEESAEPEETETPKESTETEAAEVPKEPTRTKAKKADVKESAEPLKSLTLMKAASYAGCGMRFKKNVPVPVKDNQIYRALLDTGLFIGSE